MLFSHFLKCFIHLISKNEYHSSGRAAKISQFRKNMELNIIFLYFLLCPYSMVLTAHLVLKLKVSKHFHKVIGSQTSDSLGSI